MADKPNTKAKTPKAIISFPWLANPQPLTSEEIAAGKKPKFSCTLIFTPAVLADPAEKAFLLQMEAAAMAAIDKKWPGRRSELLESETFRKGFRKDVKAKGYPAGSIFVNCRSDSQPGLVYPYAAPGTEKPARVAQEDIKKVFYPGAIVRASVDAFGYAKSGNMGVSFGLGNIQFLADGPRLDSRIAAEDDFTADLSQAPADLSSIT